MSEDSFDPLVVPSLGGQRCHFLFEGEDPEHPEVRAALRSLLDPKSDLLAAAEPYVRQYCEDVLASLPAVYPDVEPPMTLEEDADVWSHVQFGDELTVARRVAGDSEDGIYFSMECNCDWEPEHGLQLVIRDGRTISKVGPYDGHVTNSDAYGDPSLAGVVYSSIRS